MFKSTIERIQQALIRPNGIGKHLENKYVPHINDEDIDYIEYTIKPGDTLTGISEFHGISLDKLIEDNGIDTPDLIHIGQILIIKNN